MNSRVLLPAKPKLLLVDGTSIVRRVNNAVKGVTMPPHVPVASWNAVESCSCVPFSGRSPRLPGRLQPFWCDQASSAVSATENRCQRPAYRHAWLERKKRRGGALLRGFGGFFRRLIRLIRPRAPCVGITPLIRHSSDPLKHAAVEAVILKPTTPRTLRHMFTTHLPQAGSARSRTYSVIPMLPRP
jgi:hypothetical protein